MQPLSAVDAESKLLMCEAVAALDSVVTSVHCSDSSALKINKILLNF